MTGDYVGKASQKIGGKPMRLLSYNLGGTKLMILNLPLAKIRCTTLRIVVRRFWVLSGHVLFEWTSYSIDGTTVQLCLPMCLELLVQL